MPVQQYDQGQLYHLLDLQGLPADFLLSLLDLAEHIKTKGPATDYRKAQLLNLFFENSTRTRFSFELAASRLGMRVLNFDTRSASTAKGESFHDTINTLAAMRPDIFVIRHSENGAVEQAAEILQNRVSIINAGDGHHAHPTQALLDLLTIRQHRGHFDNLRLAIVGDILHSRVARSLLNGLRALGVEDLRIIAPDSLMPDPSNSLGAKPFTDLREGLDGAEVVITLRVQVERKKDHSLMPPPDEYHQKYGITMERLGWAAPNAVLMHPGPINRGVELTDEVADSSRSLILKQVENGVWIRMAIMQKLLEARA